MKKRIVYLILIACIMCLFSGCKKEDAFQVYAVKNDALYQTALNAYMKEHSDEKLQVTYFDFYEDMESQLKAELMSGAGPDVLLFNSYDQKEDIYKLCVGNSLLALDKQMKNLSENEYFQEILDAGVIDGHQYLVPLSWNILQLYSSEAKTTKNGYDNPYVAVTKEAEALATEEDYGVSSLNIGRADLIQMFAEVFGELIIESKTGELVIDKEKLRGIAEYTKVFYDNMDKMRSITQKYKNDFGGAVSHLTFLLEDYPFMNNLRFYETLYPQYTASDMQVMFFQQFGGGMTAQVVQYGAINANTQNADKAWRLLNYLLDYTSVDMNFSKYNTQAVYYAPVKKAVYENCVEQLTSMKGPGPGRKVGPLSEGNGKALSELPNQISSGVIPNVALGMLVQECLDPYLSGTESFDLCYDKLIQKLGLYLNE